MNQIWPQNDLEGGGNLWEFVSFRGSGRGKSGTNETHTKICVAQNELTAEKFVCHGQLQREIRTRAPSFRGASSSSSHTYVSGPERLLAPFSPLKCASVPTTYQGLFSRPKENVRTRSDSKARLQPTNQRHGTPRILRIIVLQFYLLNFKPDNRAQN